MRDNGVAVNVHYIPVYFHPFYQKKFGFNPGLCPMAEKNYEQILSLPIFPKMSDSDIEKVINTLMRVTARE